MCIWEPIVPWPAVWAVLDSDRIAVVKVTIQRGRDFWADVNLSDDSLRNGAIHYARVGWGVDFMGVMFSEISPGFSSSVVGKRKRGKKGDTLLVCLGLLTVFNVKLFVVVFLLECTNKGKICTLIFTETLKAITWSAITVLKCFLNHSHELGCFTFMSTSVYFSLKYMSDSPYGKWVLQWKLIQYLI